MVHSMTDVTIEFTGRYLPTYFNRAEDVTRFTLLTRFVAMDALTYGRTMWFSGTIVEDVRLKSRSLNEGSTLRVSFNLFLTGTKPEKTVK